MPDRVREVYEPLWQSVSALHVNWMLYRQVFGTGPERIDLLNEFAPVFFRATQDSMLDATFLAISRLMDPPKSARKDNLVLERLILAAKEEDELDLSLSLRLSAKLEEIKKQCIIFREIRNKRLAHNDLKAAQEKCEDDHPMMASREHIEIVLKSIRDIMNAVQVHYLGGETLYEHTILGLGDGNRLIFHFEDLKKRREESPRSRRK